jgi:hypothetical protein
MKTFLVLSILAFNLSSFASTPSVWLETQFREKKIAKEFIKIESKYNNLNLSEIFSKASLSCEINFLAKLNKIDSKTIPFAVIKAHKLGFIDEVEADILYTYAQTYKRTSQFSKTKLSIQQKETLKRNYRYLLGPGCLSDKWEDFKEKIVLQGDNDQIYQRLNQFALDNNFITIQEYKLIETARSISDNESSLLKIKDYQEKRKWLIENDLEMNDSVVSFHLTERSKGEKSRRYKLFSNFSLIQIKEMNNLLNKMTMRFNSHQSELIFSAKDGVINERIELTHTEKIRLALKLYKKEKNLLLQKDYFRGKNFDYRDLMILGFQTYQIDHKELDGLSLLEKKTIKQNFWQKSVSFLGKLDFLVAAVAGPVVGIGYSIGISILDGKINKKESKDPEFNHDLFYGNCEQML